MPDVMIMNECVFKWTYDRPNGQLTRKRDDNVVRVYRRVPNKNNNDEDVSIDDGF